MIQLQETELARIMFDIWQKSDSLKNPVTASNYIKDEVLKVKNLALSGVSGSLPTKNEAIIEKHNIIKEAEKRLTKSDLKSTLIKGIEFGFEKYHDWLMANYR